MCIKKNAYYLEEVKNINYANRDVKITAEMLFKGRKKLEITEHILQCNTFEIKYIHLEINKEIRFKIFTFPNLISKIF